MRKMLTYQSSWNPNDLFTEQVGLFSQMIYVFAYKGVGAACVLLRKPSTGSPE